MGTTTELIKLSEFSANILNIRSVDANLHKLSNQISKLTGTIDQIELENKKLRN